LAVTFRAGEMLHELHADVAGVEIGEHEHIGLARYEAAGCFRQREIGQQRGVRLEFAVDLHLDELPPAPSAAPAPSPLQSSAARPASSWISSRN